MRVYIAAMKSSVAISYFGGVSNVARITGLSKQAIYQWPEVVPMRWQYYFERLSGGVLKPKHPLPNYVVSKAEAVE